MQKKNSICTFKVILTQIGQGVLVTENPHQVTSHLWGGNLVTWRSKKQKVVALSSAEVEFRGITKGVCELLWLKRLVEEVMCSAQDTMDLFCDNKAAIAIAHNPVQHDRTKHVEGDTHFIKEKLEDKIIQFPFVKSEDQLTDILTKVVSSKIFHNSLDKLGIEDIYAPT